MGLRLVAAPLRRDQVWTPDDVADAMAEWACPAADCVLDPAVGAGALLRAARRVARDIRLEGCEIDAAALTAAMVSGCPAGDLGGVHLGDFLRWEPARRYPAILVNPPYRRHHSIPAADKQRLAAAARAVLGVPLDGRAGLQVHFLLRCLTLLAPGGRLACLLPADVCEGVFAPMLWRWIGQHFRIEAAITFAAGATPFPGVDTNAVLVLIRAMPPAGALWWARVLARDGSLAAWCRGGFGAWQTPGLHVVPRQLQEAVATGLSRAPALASAGTVLGDVCRVVCGLSTGANGFFLMTAAVARQHGLPGAALRRVVSRSRDIPDGILDAARLAQLDAAGRPTYLLAPTPELVAGDSRLRAYLRHGEALGIPERGFVAARRTWWRQEVRAMPPWIFAYLGQRRVRFIENRAGVVPLNCFHCIYPQHAGIDPAALGLLLRHPGVLDGLPWVAKSYGGGAYKVEPRALERMALPEAAVRAAGL